MSRLRTFVLISVCATLITANSAVGATANESDDSPATCAEGYYPADDGECMECGAGYYCVDNVRTACPDILSHYNPVFPESWGPIIEIKAVGFVSGNGRTSIERCSAFATVWMEYGFLYQRASYNQETEMYDLPYISWWHSVNPGHYLTTPASCGAYAYYRDIAECPAGSYCPGKGTVLCNYENKDQVLTTTFGLETCPAGTYSAAGASECTKCINSTWSDAGAVECTPCPDPSEHRRTTFPDYYYENPTYSHSYLITNLGDISSCSAITGLKTNRGMVFDYTRYNPETEEYDTTTRSLWYAAEPGYYLTSPSVCGAFAYYDDATECLAGFYCPGKDQVVCNKDNEAQVHTQTFGLEKCPAGTYSAAGATECTVCPTGTWSDAGAVECTPCPDPSEHRRTTFPDYYYENPSIISTGFVLNDSVARTGISSCAVIVRIRTDRGKVTDYARYNTNTEQYDKTYNSLWHSVTPGYYLSSPNACGEYAYYDDVMECPAGAYCPGKDSVLCDSENKAQVHTPTFGLETCPDNTWSDAGAAECTPCPGTGYGNTGDISNHVGTVSCIAHCAAGEYVPSSGDACRPITDGSPYYSAEHAVAYGDVSGDNYKKCPAPDSPGNKVYVSGPFDIKHKSVYGCVRNMPVRYNPDESRRICGGDICIGILATHGTVNNPCYYYSGDDGNAEYGGPNGETCVGDSDAASCDAGFWAPMRMFYHNGGYIPCQPVDTGYYSPDGDLDRYPCPDGTTTVGYGNGAANITDCVPSKNLHLGEKMTLIMSSKKHTPHALGLQDSTGDRYYGFAIPGEKSGTLKVRSAADVYSIINPLDQFPRAMHPGDENNEPQEIVILP